MCDEVLGLLRPPDPLAPFGHSGPRARGASCRGPLARLPRSGQLAMSCRPLAFEARLPPPPPPSVPRPRPRGPKLLSSVLPATASSPHIWMRTPS
eukprot:6451667-Pyramimonas_sp.AAC.1